MEENNLLNQIKSAAENAETKDFPGMEKVWQRVEEKLDNKEDKKAMLLWKKIAIAASLLLVATLGYQFFKTNPTKIQPSQVVTTIDSIQKNNVTSSEIVTIDSKSAEKLNITTLNPSIKKEAEQILKEQVKPNNQVALEESFKSDDNASSNGISNNALGYSIPAAAAVQSIPIQEYHFVAKKAKDVELFMDKNRQTSNEKKEEPLVIIDEKVSKKSLKEHEFNQSDSLVVLNEPLYIINGVEYTEKEVFGPNPTSPYTPLNQQEIETLSILQHDKAIEIYGNKGKKGVVIITTKNGKPVASKKAK